MTGDTPKPAEPVREWKFRVVVNANGPHTIWDGESLADLNMVPGSYHVVEFAAYAKLEARCAELQGENIRNWADAPRKPDKSPITVEDFSALTAENARMQVHLTAAQVSIDALAAENERLRSALERIAKYIDEMPCDHKYSSECRACNLGPAVRDALAGAK